MEVQRALSKLTKIIEIKNKKSESRFEPRNLVLKPRYSNYCTKLTPREVFNGVVYPDNTVRTQGWIKLVTQDLTFSTWREGSTF